MTKIGEIRLETEHGEEVLPVYDTSDAGSSVYNMVRVQTSSGTGFIPFVDYSSATHDYLRIQTENNGVLAAHDEPTLYSLPSSAVHKWKYSEGSGNSAGDSLASAEASLNGVSWTSGSYQDGYALDSKGGNYYTQVSASSIDENNGPICDGGWAVAFTIDNYGGSGGDFMGTMGGGSGHNREGWRIADNGGGGIIFYMTDSNTNTGKVYTDNSSLLNDGKKHRVVVQKTGNGELNSYAQIWVDAESRSYSTSWSNNNQSDFTGLATDFITHANNDGNDNVVSYSDIILDNVILFEDNLSSSQIQEDYKTQPWN